VPVRAVRSTLVTSGLVVLRERQLFERYAQALPPHHRETMQSLVAGTWLPTDFMLAHYAAWDSLDLSSEDIRVIGGKVASRVSENLLLAARYIAAGAGVTPWTALAQCGRFWTRAFDGGGIRVERHGPKDATVTVVEIPFARSAYFRGSMLAIHENVLGLLVSKMYVRLLPASVAASSFALRLAWA
jgi:hypothetical protein